MNGQVLRLTQAALAIRELLRVADANVEGVEVVVRLKDPRSVSAALWSVKQEMFANAGPEDQLPCPFAAINFSFEVKE
jgi:hypothetical protein